MQIKLEDIGAQKWILWKEILIQPTLPLIVAVMVVTATELMEIHV